MAEYTMALREYIERFTQDQEGLSHRERIEAGRTHLFDFDYPIFDPDYKKTFETHFIRHFYFREIGFETEEDFKFHLETELNQQMPYFNKLFESELIDFDPLKNSETDMTHNKKNNTTSNSSTTGSSHSESEGSNTTDTNNERNQSGDRNKNDSKTTDDFNRKIEADVPDTRLALTTNDGEGVLDYASKIEENSSNNKDDIKTDESHSENETGTSHGESKDSLTSDTNADSTSEGTIDNVEDYIQHRSGKIGVQSYSKMLIEYRETFLRLENQIFSEFEELFMLVY